MIMRNFVPIPYWIGENHFWQRKMDKIEFQETTIFRDCSFLKSRWLTYCSLQDGVTFRLISILRLALPLPPPCSFSSLCLCLSQPPDRINKESLLIFVIPVVPRNSCKVVLALPLSTRWLGKLVLSGKKAKPHPHDSLLLGRWQTAWQPNDSEKNDYTQSSSGVLFSHSKKFKWYRCRK